MQAEIIFIFCERARIWRHWYSVFSVYWQKATRKCKMATLDDSPSLFIGKSWSEWAENVPLSPLEGKIRTQRWSYSNKVLSFKIIFLNMLKKTFDSESVNHENLTFCDLSWCFNSPFQKTKLTDPLKKTAMKRIACVCLLRVKISVANIIYLQLL